MPTCDNKVDVRRAVFGLLLLLPVAVGAGCQAQRIGLTEPAVLSDAAQPQADSSGSQVPADAKRWYLRAMVAEGRGELVEAQRSMLWVLRLDRRSEWSLQACRQFYERHQDLDRDACDH